MGKSKMKQYEITEDNDWEGETFGYLVNLTEEQFSKIHKRFKQINEEEGYDKLLIEESNLSERDVDLVNRKSNNSYMDRISYCELLESVDLDNFEYNDFPYKGNGLKRIR